MDWNTFPRKELHPWRVLSFGCLLLRQLRRDHLFRIPMQNICTVCLGLFWPPAAILFFVDFWAEALVSKTAWTCLPSLPAECSRPSAFAMSGFGMMVEEVSYEIREGEGRIGVGNLSLPN